MSAAPPRDRLLRNALIGVGALWILYALLMLFLPQGMPAKGTFGDAFGALNTLFSGLAFAILIATINLQRRELELQRIEMEQTRTELEGQKLQLATQNELTVLAARLSALPNLIEQEKSAIVRTNRDLTTWIATNSESESATKLLAESEQELKSLRQQVPELDAQLRSHPHPGSPAAGGIHGGLDRATGKLQQLERSIPRLVRLRDYLQDFETIYERLKAHGSNST